MSNVVDLTEAVKRSLATELGRTIVGIRRRNSQIFRLQKTTPEAEGGQSTLCGELRSNGAMLVDALDKLTKSNARPTGTPVDPGTDTTSVMEELMKGKPTTK